MVKVVQCFPYHCPSLGGAAEAECALAVVAEPHTICAICKIGLDWSTLNEQLYLAEVVHLNKT
jgi:hypothetical protein